MYNTEIGYFCSQHEDWLEILSASPFFLKIKRDGNYVIFNYDQIHSDFNNRIVQEARGIIFKNGQWENPVCWAFNKFGNYGESYVPEIDWSTAFVTEKIDGSLIKMWYDENKWHISTNSTIDAYKATLGDIKYESFGEYFKDIVYDYFNTFTEVTLDLNPDLTYMFELVGPYNRVVIPYEEPAIYFLGARDKFTGEEFFCNATEMERCSVSEFHRPKVFPLRSLDDCIKAAEELGWDEEGFVVVDHWFHRVKIKSPAYVMAHYARNNNVINKKHLLKVILANETEEFLCYAADYKDELFNLKAQINLFINVGNKLAEACRAIADKLERPDYARLVKALPEIYHGLLFFNYDKVFTMEDFTQKWDENKWETYLDTFEKLRLEFTKIDNQED